MRNMLAFLAALVLTFLGLGYYLDWYRLGTRPAGQGHREVTIDINTVKIGKDLEKAEDQVKHKLADAKTQPTQSDSRTTPAHSETNWLEPTHTDGLRGRGKSVSGNTGREPARGPLSGKLDIELHDLDKWLENR